MWMQAVTALKKLNVPYLVSLPLVFQTTEEWLDSELGVHPVQVALQVPYSARTWRSLSRAEQPPDKRVIVSTVTALNRHCSSQCQAAWPRAPHPCAAHMQVVRH